MSEIEDDVFSSDVPRFSRHCSLIFYFDRHVYSFLVETTVLDTPPQGGDRTFATFDRTTLFVKSLIKLLRPLDISFQVYFQDATQHSDLQEPHALAGVKSMVLEI